MDPNDTQVGGNHYREIPGEQHWDRIWRKYGRGYFVGQITKYVERYHLKNGLQDLEKARHFLDKLITLEYPTCPKCGVMEKDHGDCASESYVAQ